MTPALACDHLRAALQRHAHGQATREDVETAYYRLNAVVRYSRLRC